VLQKLQKQVDLGRDLEQTAQAAIGSSIDNRALMGLHDEHLFEGLCGETTSEIDISQDLAEICWVAKLGQNGHILSLLVLFRYCASGHYHSLVIFFGVFDLLIIGIGPDHFSVSA